MVCTGLSVLEEHAAFSKVLYNFQHAPKSKAWLFLVLKSPMRCIAFIVSSLLVLSDSALKTSGTLKKGENRLIFFSLQNA